MWLSEIVLCRKHPQCVGVRGKGRKETYVDRCSDHQMWGLLVNFDFVPLELFVVVVVVVFFFFSFFVVVVVVAEDKLFVSVFHRRRSW
jgi:hypothetical protein